ncbi:MAG: hypothetical protein A3D10_03750 [Omnitrophica WOR_2 bacterium RIFCSPHIGHO2_02_FULL_48_11]|nr:MAG: hypothetical protein A3D10_03750 [Omnitrophica WOR_2 bacterium RIFCSPHIGHO2_02_FULL_48_11]
MSKEYPFAKRTDWEMTQNELISQLDEARKSGKDIIDLTESNPTRCQFSYPKEKILKKLSAAQNILYDPSPRGNLSARQAIAQYYKNKHWNVSPGQIFLSASTSEAYTFLFRLLTNPGERVLFPRPSYPLFEFLVGLNDIKMDTYPLVYHHRNGLGQWSLDLDALRQEIQSTTKAIVLVNPNNPTGSFIKKHELEELNKICAEYNIALISDEVFMDYSFQKNNSKAVSLVENHKVLTFTMGGLSKTLALPQMKLSWIIVNGPEQIVSQASERLEIILDTYLSVNTPVQNALDEWLALQPEINKNILDRVMANRQFLVEQIRDFPACEFLEAEGGWYAIIQLPPERTEETWILDFLNEDHVFVHPGYFFDFLEEPYIVVSLLPPVGQFQTGIRRVLMRIRSTVNA